MSKAKENELQIIQSIKTIKKDIDAVKKVTNHISGIKKITLTLVGLSVGLSVAEFVYHRISLKRLIRREVNKEVRPLKEEIERLKEQNRRLARKNKALTGKQPVR